MTHFHQNTVCGRVVETLVALVCALFVSLSASAATLHDGEISVQYDGGDENIAQRTLQVTKDTLDDLAPRLPKQAGPIRIVIAPSHDRFRQYAGPYTHINVGGVAVPEAGLIAIKSPGILSGDADYESILRHEIIHLLLARNFNVQNMPRWLNEGTAMSLSGEWRWGNDALVSYMYLRGTLIPYENLDFTLEGTEYDGRLGEAYAQSLSMTRYLMDQLGEERFWRFLRSLDEQRFDRAIRAETGIAPMPFWRAWHDSLWKVAAVFSLVSGFSAFQLIIVLAALAWWRLRRRNRALVRQWEEDEEDEPPYLFAHELEGREAPYPWEEDDDEARL